MIKTSFKNPHQISICKKCKEHVNMLLNQAVILSRKYKLDQPLEQPFCPSTHTGAHATPQPPEITDYIQYPSPTHFTPEIPTKPCKYKIIAYQSPTTEKPTIFLINCLASRATKRYTFSSSAGFDLAPVCKKPTKRLWKGRWKGKLCCAAIAQLVEQLICNFKVDDL